MKYNINETSLKDGNFSKRFDLKNKINTGKGCNFLQVEPHYISLFKNAKEIIQIELWFHISEQEIIINNVLKHYGNPDKINFRNKIKETSKLVSTNSQTTINRFESENYSDEEINLQHCSYSWIKPNFILNMSRFNDFSNVNLEYIINPLGVIICSKIN